MTDEERLIIIERELERIKQIRLEDQKFYMIALNLTGKRKKYEDKAFKLIKKHGLLEALKLSKKPSNL